MSSFLPSFNIPPNQRGIYLLRPRPAGCANTGAVNRISDAAFDARWDGTLITFEEYAIGFPNPTFEPSQYGGGLTSPYVATGPYFYGQTQTILVVEGPVSPPPPTPDNEFNGPAFIVNDGARPPGEQRALSGSPFLNGPLCFAFMNEDFTAASPVVGVSINVGFCNAIGTIRVRAYDSVGTLLGTWFNETLGGYENFNLNRDSNIPNIAGILVDNFGGDLAGYTVSRVRFSNKCA